MLLIIARQTLSFQNFFDLTLEKVFLPMGIMYRCVFKDNQLDGGKWKITCRVIELDVCE